MGARLCTPVRAAQHIEALIGRELDPVGRTEDTVLTAFTDGCPGLRRILADADITELPILDWFHIGMRLQHLIPRSRAQFAIWESMWKMLSPSLRARRCSIR
jgi:hypothetical protein